MLNNANVMHFLVQKLCYITSFAVPLHPVFHQDLKLVPGGTGFYGYLHRLRFSFKVYVNGIRG